jgi:N-acetylglucosamine kinase-like BadF-type ATPase
MMPSYYLGVDGGQSSTTALIGDDTGQVIGYGRSGPCNHVEAAEGRAKLTRAIEGSLQAACEQAGIDWKTVRFASTCMGFSGGAEDKEGILREIVRSDRWIVTHDAAIALSGAIVEGTGIIVIAGTGSMVFGRNAAQQTARAGGWGYIYGDEGGGFDLTRQALRAALRFEEGWGPPTSLHTILLAETGSKSADELLHRFYRPEFPRPAIAAYSKLVDRAAEAGDVVAQKLLTNAAQELALLAHAVREHLFGGEDQVTIAYAGGVFRSRMLLERFQTILELHDRVRVVGPAYGPAAGALMEAYRADGNGSQLSQVPEIEK